MARRRAVVLILVHILIIAHILHWQLRGRTLAPVVLSDSMLALEHGRITPAAILFALAILVTLLCGRFLCGWACHMGALQDLCAWSLKKVGVRPRLFRARLLGYIPLGLALYMFVWPTFKRAALVPLLAAGYPDALSLLSPVPPIAGFSTELLTDDLWARLPGPVLAVPFLLICGVGTVYFLGARGLCRYGCPYGGVFAPLERLAPGRIVVDLDACDRCGICTAVCSSGIRVHEEVNAYGRVVSNACVKTLDCVSACPQSALSFSFTTPGLLKGKPIADPPRPRYDLTWPQELAVAAVFLAVLFTVRGLYGTFPLLMSISIATCTAFIAWKASRLAVDRDVRFLNFQLRRAGRLRPAGAAFAGLALLLAALVAHSAVVRSLHLYAGRIDHAVDVPREEVFSSPRPALPEAVRAAAERALRLYALASSWRHGGIALADTHEADIRAAYLALVLADHPRAESLLLRAIERGGRSDGLSADLARIMLLQGHNERAAAYLAAVVDATPGCLQSLDLLCALHEMSGDLAAIESLYRRELARPGALATPLLIRLARLLTATGRAPEALAELEPAAAAAPGDVPLNAELAFTLAAAGDPHAALATLDHLARANPAAADQCHEWSTQIRAAFGLE